MVRLSLIAAFLCLPAFAAIADPRPYDMLLGGDQEKCSKPDVSPDERISYCATILKMGIGQGFSPVGSKVATADTVLQMAIAYRQKRQSDLAGKHFDFAERLITEALVKSPDSPELLSERCWIAAISGERLDAALSDCEHAQKIQSGKTEILSRLGFVLYRANKYSEALDAYNAVLNEKPNDVGATYMRAMVKQGLGDSVGAATDLKAAKEKDYRGLTALTYKLYGVEPK